MIKMNERTRRDDYTDTLPRILRYDSPIDYRTLMNTLQIFSDRYPFVGITYMGTSVLGRGIPMVSMGGQRGSCKSVLYVGAHHGMEHITTGVLLKFINDYCEIAKEGGHAYNVAVGRLLRSRTIHVIPQLNVDGVDLQINGADRSILRDRLISMNGGEDFSHWQANARGVDLNHNYDAGFYEYKKLEAELGIKNGDTKFSGEAPESEPETASLSSLLRYSDEIRGVLTLHSQGEEIYASSGGESLYGMAAAAKLMSSMTGYKIAEPEGTAAYGGLTDWCIKKLRRPSFTIECGKGENPLPYTELDDIYGKLRELLFTFPLLV